MCSWGPDASRIEVAFDWLAVEAELAGRPYVEDVLMTTSQGSRSTLRFGSPYSLPSHQKARPELSWQCVTRNGQMRLNPVRRQRGVEGSSP
jgi:hypothetical protein